jgi:hypothetical protein
MLMFGFIRSGKVKVPEWADLVKTAVFKELAPFDEDWFLIRMASLARHIYIRSPIGVKTVKRIYGGMMETIKYLKEFFCLMRYYLCRTQKQWCEAIPFLRQLRLSRP